MSDHIYINLLHTIFTFHPEKYCLFGSISPKIILSPCFNIFSLFLFSDLFSHSVSLCVEDVAHEEL